MSLSKRVRPGVEAAPWVVQEIAALEAKVRELEAELQRRAKQIGVACMKHDLTHSLACGRCYAESRQQVERLKELWFSDADPLETEFRNEALAAVEKERHNDQAKGPARSDGPA